MSHKPTIAVDIDDVIAAGALGFIQYTNDRFGMNLTIDDYDEHWQRVWKVDHEEVQKRAIEYHESGHISKHDIISGACDTLECLKKRFRLIVLTSRRSSIDKPTRDWIEKFYPGIFEDIVFSGIFDSDAEDAIHMTKGEIAKKLGVHYLIDDQPKHVLAASDMGIHGLLFGNYAWNKMETLPENVTRVVDWNEVLEFF